MNYGYEEAVQIFAFLDYFIDTEMTALWECKINE